MGLLELHSAVLMFLGLNRDSIISDIHILK